MKRLCIVVAVAAACGLTAYRAAATTDGAAQRVELTAAKFTFSASEIRIKKGQPVTFVLTAADFAHGFSVPDFNVRADFIPEKTVQVTFTPDRAGRFVFLCDNFCGEGHEVMSGILIVED